MVSVKIRIGMVTRLGQCISIMAGLEDWWLTFAHQMLRSDHDLDPGVLEAVSDELENILHEVVLYTMAVTPYTGHAGGLYSLMSIYLNC